MYYLDEIMDRTFDSWSTMLDANNNSFWAVSEIEIKPTLQISNSTENSDSSETPDTSETTEIPAREPADKKSWNASSDYTSGSNQISETLHNLADTTREVLKEINPFQDNEKDNYT